MNKLLAVAMVAAAIQPAAQATDVGVSIGISQPGVYGRIDIGRFPQPAVIVPQPVIIAPPPVAVVRAQPVYLWVPPGHRKHWATHCREYNACGVPVYFVRQDWYEQNVRYADQGDRRGAQDGGHGKGHGKGQGKGRD
jgi:hypothetical protein